MQPTASAVHLVDAVKALAFVGDLSMGQPVDHSVRAAWIAAQLAAALGYDAEVQRDAGYVSLLRWSGCTANAPEFAEHVGDDVAGRNAMLTESSFLPNLAAWAPMMSTIHCEVSGDIARTLGMPAAVQHALRNIFESFDGRGTPAGLRGDAIPIEVFLAAAAGDLEIFSRVYGLTRALEQISGKADARYPAALTEQIRLHAADWLHALDQGAAHTAPGPAAGSDQLPSAPLELIADVIDLKLPWLTGFSRKVADAALQGSARLGMSAEQQQCVYRAGLIHGIGRASVPNAVWDASGPPSESAREQLRLVPYWTSRAAQRLGSLATEAELASFVGERLDGSGYFRGASGAAIAADAQLLAAAEYWVGLQSARPGAPAMSADHASAQLREQAGLGRFAPQIVEALTAPAGTRSAAPLDAAPVLSAREVEVLRRISLGESNKEAARALGISPSTIRAHLENIFRKLDCGTRAAATLKASTMGLF
jgi:HD-GYP domain-containing protein (c-di-GMP phosphodiesterase class II)/DNA-binding CsgD family transcriptional regulator